MNRVIAMFFSMAMVAMPLSAASVDLGLWVVIPELQGSNRNDASGVEIDLDEEIGLAGTASVIWTSGLSTEVGIYSFSADGSLRSGGAGVDSVDLGEVGALPITLTMRGHFGGEQVNFYVGGGGAYVRFDDFSSDDLRLAGVERIQIDDQATWLANAGVSFHLKKNLRIGIDLKYFPVKVRRVQLPSRERVDLELDPLLLSGGVIYRF